MSGRIGRLARLLALFLAVLPASAQNLKNDSLTDITFLVDLSYGMRLPLSLNKDDIHGSTRLDEGKKLLRAIIDGSGSQDRWALLTFGGTPEPPSKSSVRIRQELTGNAHQLLEKVDALSTWGTSPLAEAIVAAERYSARVGPDRRQVIVVVSDGIGTAPGLYDMPSPESLRHFRARIVFAGIALRESPELTVALRSWLKSTGGYYVEAADISAVEAAMRMAESERVEEAKGATIRPVPSSVADTRRRVSANGWPLATRVESYLHAAVDQLQNSHPFSPPGRSLLFLLVVPLPFVGQGLISRKRRRGLSLVRALRVKRRVLRFRCEAFGQISDREFAMLPAELSERRGGATGPIVELRNDQVVLTSSALVLVNGVDVRRATLKKGDRIRSGQGLWLYQGSEVRVSGPPDPPRPRGGPLMVAASVVIALAAVLFAMAGPRETFSAASALFDGGTLQGAGAADAIGRAAPLAPEDLVANKTDLSATRLPETNRPPRFVALVGATGPVKPYVHTEMIAPGMKPDYFKADMMFIHAHPDDESINFGGLMALEARAGKKIVTVIFTDGNAGLDQFPNRRVGGMYAAYALRGNALARVRAREAEAALSILGSREYVRLGLRNNPYDSIDEILPLHEVLRRWGGEATVVHELARLIEGFRPEIVVSPDEHHPGVFTHFEHEAVGYVTDQALSVVRSDGYDFVRAHLIDVDPMLTAEYHGVFGVNVMATDPDSGLTYRAIQVAALKDHATQRDASIIAVEVVPNFASEYYVAKFWTLPQRPQQYFAPVQIASRGSRAGRELLR